MKKILLPFLISAVAFSLYAQNDDPSCRDKTLQFFSPMEGFYVTDFCKYTEFGRYEFWVDGSSRAIVKEGVYRETWYHRKEDSQRHVSGLQILRNYVNAIKAVGGNVLKESDGNILTTTFQGKELWILVNVNTNSTDQDNYGIFSIEVDAMKQEVTAQDIQGSIATLGKIALYGIQFDTGKSDIKPESEKAISSVATYLKENPNVNVLIVGHTDNVGSFDMNQALSKSRGESVKKYLASKYGIPESRLTGNGVGSLCPVASNDTDEGKALNRRVEIVKK